jgi:hypothetical protein
MRTCKLFALPLILTTLCLSIFSCVKTEDTAPVDKNTNKIPEVSRIRIHFGTSTQQGCLYSFSNCIWIGWGSGAINSTDRFALQFDQGDEASAYFGQYYPLTADYTVTPAEAAALGIETQVIPAGFYPLREMSAGQATGRRMAILHPQMGTPVASLVNPENPQDDIGQLHNLAVQVVLHNNREAILSLKGNKEAIRALLTEKLMAFMDEAGVPVEASIQAEVKKLDLNRDFSQFAARLEETSLSASDKRALLEVFEKAAAIPVSSPEQLSNFVSFMTEKERTLSTDTSLNDSRTVLAMVSTLKYSRYFWFWKSLSNGDSGNGTPQASEIPDWVWADVIGLELGGPAASALASAIVYLDTH